MSNEQPPPASPPWPEPPESAQPPDVAQPSEPSHPTVGDPRPTLRELVGSTNPYLTLAAPIEELLVPYDPAPLTERLRRRRRAMWSRLVSLGITAVILVLLYSFGGDRLRAGGFLAVYGFALGVSVVWFLAYLVAFLLARRDLRRVGTGTAVRIGRPGVQVAGVFAPWSEVAALGVATGRAGRRPRLELRRTGGPASAVPLEQVVVHPATLDSTTRAYSGGRHGVDLTALDG